MLHTTINMHTYITYIHTYIHAYIHTYITYIHTYISYIHNIHVHTCTCVSGYMDTMYISEKYDWYTYKKKGSRHSFLTIKNLLHHQWFQRRNNQHHVVTTNFTVLTCILHIFVLLGSKIDFHNQKTKVSLLEHKELTATTC